MVGWTASSDAAELVVCMTPSGKVSAPQAALLRDRVVAAIGTAGDTPVAEDKVTAIATPEDCRAIAENACAGGHRFVGIMMIVTQREHVAKAFDRLRRVGGVRAHALPILDSLE